MARIATVYSDNSHPWQLLDMSYIRWQKISEALARQGHEVDIVSNEAALQNNPHSVAMAERLRRVPLRGIDWARYDVIKTLFHGGFDVLERHHGARHPFVISKLGSVVAAEDRPGIYFYAKVREQLFRTQAKIHRRSRYVTVLSEAGRQLFCEAHGQRAGVLLVPGGVDRDIPPPSASPFAGIPEKVCIFSGNIYNADSQPEANRVLVDKLNQLGENLAGSGMRVCFQGNGDTTRIDPRLVTLLGSCAYQDTWSFLQHAAVGIVVSAGAFMHNNESTKIYHYLRAGLPVVSEAGFPNDDVVRQSGLGFVTPSGDMSKMADAIRRAAETTWSREAGVEYVLTNHTWDCRAQVYAQVLPQAAAGTLTQLVRRAKMRLAVAG